MTGVHSGLGGIHNIGKNCVGERMMCLEGSVTLGVGLSQVKQDVLSVLSAQYNLKGHWVVECQTLR